MEKLCHILSADQFDKSWLEQELFPLTDEMRTIAQKGGCEVLPPNKRRMITLFYEPSTRTRFSFQTAMDMLGGRVVCSTENAKEFSGAAKGEIIEDTIRVIASYHPSVIVLRSPVEGMARIAASYSTVPIINAGDGKGEHPTQALLDIYTIKQELGRVDGLSIAMCGDLLNGRTVRSLSYLLSKFTGIRIYFVSPKAAGIKDDVKKSLQSQGVSFEESCDLREVANLVDVIYQTRLQKERGTLTEWFSKENGFFVVDRELLGLMKKDAIIIHPLPRNEEITPEVDSDRRAAYFRQAQNGLYVRMALLKMVLAP